MHMPPKAQIFEYRSAERHINDPKRKRAMLLISGLLVGGISAMFVGIFWMMGIENWADFQQAFSATKGDAATSTGLPHSAQKDFATNQQPAWQPAFLYPFLGYLLVIGVLQWVRHAAPKRCSLTLTEDALIHVYRLPLGLNAIVPANWCISLRDITAVEFIQSPLLGAIPAPVLAQLRISQSEGPTRSIRPAMWFVPGSPARPPLKPTGKPSLFASPSGMWLKPENQAIVRAAFADFPIVQALRARGIAVPDAHLPANIQDHDLFACRSIMFGIVAGLALVIATLAIMIGHKHQHLQSDLPLSLYFVLGGVALLMLWLIGRRDTQRPPVGHSILAAIFLVAGVAMATQPMTVLVNGFGVTSNQSQAFVVRAGNLEPVDGQTGIGAIELPGTQSRQGWLKEGTPVSLVVKKGRLALWEYDDTPLRQLADAQGIR